MEIRLLGPLEVRDGERTVALPRRQQRALLAALALRAGEVVSTDRLVADLWGERAPASATGSLQNTVSALRKTLGRELVLTQAPGYRLALAPDNVDAHRFERLLADARGADEAARASLLNEALALWRGPALADLDEEQFARLEAARLDELRVAAQEERIAAELALGRHAALVGELEALVAAHPLREPLCGQLMLTLYRCARQAEALEVYRALRLALADELGLDPSPELQELQRRILRQDPLLDPPVEDRAAPVAESAERRLVTVLAALPPADDDPERHRRLLDETLTAVRDALARNGGVLERFGPEGLVAVFGAESPSDEDAHRALATAEELGLPTGIATGEVVAGVGPVVNRAVELARSTGIALDERTQALVNESRRLDAPLVGRDEELARLTALLSAESCRVVTIVGEPGIGKTRLARELALHAGHETTVLVARCASYGEGATFLPLLGALRRAAPERALAGEDDAELVLSRLTALAGGEDTVSLGESYWAVRRLLEALSPALLILDDVHWAEPALLDLVDYLGERAKGALMVLCLTRPELDRSFGETLQLGPLDDEHARELVPPELDEGTRERIVGLAEGNALYVEQLASFAAEGGGGLPPTLDAVLAGRLGRLDPPERIVLQRAAVVGREFSLGAVAALADGDVARNLLALSRAGFIHAAAATDPGDDGYTFHHVLLRDAAYASLTKADRADLHERAAAWLDRNGPGDDALVGYHLEQAVRYRRELGEDVDELAATAGARLGEAGMRVWITNDTAAAATLLRRSTDLLPSGPRRGELLWELTIALRVAGRSEESAATLAEAAAVAAECSDAGLHARVETERTRRSLLAGETGLADAVQRLEETASVLRANGDERGLGRALVALCSVHQLACNLAEVEVAAKEAREHYVASGFSPAACFGLEGDALYFGSTPVADAEARCLELLAVAPDRTSEANLMAVLGALSAAGGRVSDGRSLIAHAQATLSELGSDLAVASAVSPLAMEVEVYAGDIESAIRIGRENFDELFNGGHFAHASTRAVYLADLSLDIGALEDARRFAAEAESTMIPTDVLVQFLFRAVRARLLAHAGDVVGAALLVGEALEIARLTDAVHARVRTHLAAADVFQVAGRAADVHAQLAEASRLAAAKGIRAGAAPPLKREPSVELPIHGA